MAQRRLIGVVVAAVMLAGCGTSQPTLVVTTPQPSAAAVIASASPNPSASPTPSPSPQPSAKPTPRPKATLRPALLKVGKLTYTASGCWSSNYRDAEGHGISGTMVDFSVTIKNAGQVTSGATWFAIESTDWFSTTPTLFDHNFTLADYRSNEREIAIAGPKIGAGKSRTFKWSVLFQAPFDVHYTMAVAPGQFGSLFMSDLMVAVAQDSAQHWTLWTSTEVCF